MPIIFYDVNIVCDNTAGRSAFIIRLYNQSIHFYFIYRNLTLKLNKYVKIGTR